MNRFFTKSFALVALVGGMTVMATSGAEAALSLQITEFSALNVQLNQVTVTDQQALVDNQPLVGVVGFSGAVGSWIVNAHTGIGDPVFTDQPHVDIAYQTTGLGPAGNYLTVAFTQTGTTEQSPLIQLTLGGTNNNTTTSAALWADDGDGAFALTDLIGAIGFGTTTLPFPAGYTGTYSLTQVVKITKTNNQGASANASGDFEAIGVPEPVSLSLLGLGLAGLAVRRRRKA